MSAEKISASIAVLALAVSMVTAWLTLFHRGTVKLTRPTQIFFGTDGSGWGESAPNPKIYLRALLFATSKRGRVVESMYVAIARDDDRQRTFNMWVYGEREKLVRGSGLFVGETGVEANHHFLMSPDSAEFQFSPGRYRLNVFAHLLGDRQGTLMFSDEFEIALQTARELRGPDAGVYFDWAPDLLRYVCHVERRPSLAKSIDASRVDSRPTAL